MKPVFKYLTALLLMLLAITALVIRPVEDTILEDSEFYRSTINTLDSITSQPIVARDTIKAGWAKINFTPGYRADLAGYGMGAYESISDSVFIRTIIFENEGKRIALITADLLIFPPHVRKVLDEKVEDLDLDGIFFGATHTHHSVGNWHPGIVGKLFAGSYDEKIVDILAGKVFESLTSALQNVKASKIGFAAVEAEDLVFNRLVREMGTVDPWARFLIIQQDSGATAVLSTFSAHPTNIYRSKMTIHRDYPGTLVDELERRPDIDFAAFMAGAVGSHGPKGKGVAEEKAQYMGSTLADQIALVSNVVVPDYQSILEFNTVPILLGESQFRINQGWRIRPWLFNTLFGEYEASIKFLRLGNTIIVGMPCDFSGELVGEIEQELRTFELNLIVSSFNGDYIGYITKDDWYCRNSYETRTMNWFGPNNGKYLSTLALRGALNIGGVNE